MTVYYVNVTKADKSGFVGNAQSSGPFVDRKMAERAAAGALETGAIKATISVRDEEVEEEVA